MKLGRIASVAAFGAGAWYAWRRLKRQNNPLTLDNSVVLITGGSRGFGLAMAREFAVEGARLALLARDHTELERARQDILSREAERGPESTAEVITVRCDVRSEQQVKAAIDEVIRHYGRIDVVVNNAGVIVVGPQEHMSIDDYRDAMDTHLWGPLYMIRAASPHMKRQGGGRIVNISSIGGKVPFPHLAPYVASKYALVGLSNTMRAELSKDRITVTTVCPMTMRTGSHYNVYYKGRRGSEMNWFAVLDALPFTSVDAGLAARQVVEACRNGDAEVFIVPPVRVAAVLANVFPGIMASLLSFINQLLPRHTSAHGDQARIGWEVRAPLAPSVLTYLNDRAAEELNELKGHLPIVSSTSSPSPSPVLAPSGNGAYKKEMLNRAQQTG